jgi:hypothetical protein
MLRDIGEIQKLATKYSKPQLARMAQMGLIDPTKAVMAGMMIDRITKSNMQPPQTTVADEALMPMQPPAAPPMQQAQPPVAPSGIGALPTQPEPNAGVAALPSGITEMAGGGIVAFDEGGEVPGYAGDDGSFVRPSMFGSMAAPNQTESENTLRLINEASQRPSPVAELFRSVEAGRQENIAQYNQKLEGIRQKMAAGTPLTPQEQTLARYNNLTPATAPAQTGTATQADVRRVDNALNPLAAPAPQPEGRAQVPAARRTQAAPANQSPEPTGLQSIKPPDPFVLDPNVGKFTVDKYPTLPKKEIKDALREQEEADRIAGVNTNIYKDLMGDLEGKKGKLAQRKQEAIGTALMQTGLGLLGARRGQEFAVLGESGQRALQGLVNANERIRDTEEKIDDARRNLLISENDYKRTRSDKALSAVEKQRDKIEQLEIKNIDNQNTENHAQAKIGVDLQGQRVQARGQDVQQYGYQLQSQTSLETEKMRGERSVQVARINAAAANRPGETERMMAEHDRILRTQGPEAAEKYLQLQERIAGRGKASGANLQEQYADDWNKMDIMQRKNMKEQGITTEQQYIDYRLRLAGRQPTSQQGGNRAPGAVDTTNPLLRQ